MGKSYGTIRDRLNLCGSCSKPIVDSNYYSITLKSKSTKNYHNDYLACANAEPLPKDWYRQNDRTSTHYRTQAGLQESDGHSGNTDDDMSMWLRDMELEDGV